ncbi:Histone H2A deubiquitinase MYSM1 [Armadillidium vulgare]|nr:Histone H2A deubiquitinase MYSM1 [Armadillidium vulgare]
MSTKSASQVKRYYKEWSQTGNVIPDSVNLANDSSIYLPFSGDGDKFFPDTDANCLSDMLQRDRVNNNNNNLVSESTSFSSSSSSCGEIHPFGFEMSMGEDIVVSSLNDWNIGSQVSVIGSEEELFDTSQELPRRKLKCEKSDKIKGSPKLIKRGNLSKVKRLINDDNKKKMKGVASPFKYAYNNFNIRLSSKSVPVLEGQIIRINKDEDENSEVNIDDDNDSGNEKAIDGDCLTDPTKLLYDESKLDFCDGMLQGLSEEERICFQNISRDEYQFCLSLIFQYSDADIKKYIAARNCIIDEWHKVKPFRLDVKRMKIIVPEADIHFYSDVFSYLEVKNFINDFRDNLSNKNKNCNIHKEIKVIKNKIPNRKKTPVTKNVLGNGNLRENIDEKGGGITFSHDSSGAVVDAVHIAESSSTTKLKTIDSEKKCDGHNLKLINCSHYDSKNSAPFKVFLHPLTILSLDFHSHSSFSEVIGLLGGFLDEARGVLHVAQAVPTRAFSSDLECEMCPLSQKEAFVEIQEKGMEVVGWYHSHPSFVPNPSQKDLDTQSQFQKWFSKNGSPFIGLIISSYCPTPSASPASIIRTFILDTNTKRKSQFFKVAHPYELKWRILNEYDMEWDKIELILNNILQQKKYQSGLVRWNDEWLGGVTYLQKYIFSLSSILPSFNEEVINLVFDYLIETLYE